MKNKQKKISVQSIAFGCTMLSAILIGTWLLFPIEEMIAEHKPEPFSKTKNNIEEERTVKLNGEEQQKKVIAQFREPQEAMAKKPTMDDDNGAIKTPSHLLAYPLTAEQEKMNEEANNPPDVGTHKETDFQDTLQHIEKKEYTKELNFPTYLNEIVHKLTSKPPVVLRETDNLYTLLSNTAHFFRILGKKNIQLIKNILNQEKARLEDIAAGLYATINNQDSKNDRVQLDIPFATAYEYAGFFLHTMGGRSYLFRREAKARLLVNYYAVLIIDQANRNGLNSYGITLNEMLPRLIGEIEANNQLVNKEAYLEQLYTLTNKYPLD